MSFGFIVVYLEQRHKCMVQRDLLTIQSPVKLTTNQFDDSPRKRANIISSEVKFRSREKFNRRYHWFIDVPSPNK